MSLSPSWHPCINSSCPGLSWRTVHWWMLADDGHRHFTSKKSTTVPRMSVQNCGKTGAHKRTLSWFMFLDDLPQCSSNEDTTEHDAFSYPMKTELLFRYEDMWWQVSKRKRAKLICQVLCSPARKLLPTSEDRVFLIFLSVSHLQMLHGAACVPQLHLHQVV